MNGPRKVYIKSYGCQMNVYDSHRMADTLAPEGYVETDSAENADLVVLNTCHIREKAADKVYSELGRLREMKDEAARNGRRVTIAVAGCVAQAEGKEIFRRERAVDLVVGPQSYHRLPDLLRQAEREGRALDTEFPAEDKFDFLPAASREATRKRGVAAFVTIQEGCDKFCTFCVVPYTRGAEVSRPVAKIIADVERLADTGVREVTLLGQNVNAYHGEGPDGRTWTLGRLLWRLAEIPGIARLRYTTSHPRDVDDALIAAHRDLPALMPQLHLPVQSGSDRILAAMNRQHTRAGLSRRDREVARDAQPDLVLHLGFHRRLSRRKRRGFPRHPPPDRGGWFHDRVHVQIFAASRHAGRGDGRSDRGRRESEPARGIAVTDQSPARALPASLRRPHLRCAVRESPASSTARSPAARLICSPCR